MRAARSSTMLLPPAPPCATCWIRWPKRAATLLASWSLDGVEKMPASVDEDENKPRISATGQIEKDYGARTASIVTLDNLIAMLKANGDDNDLRRLEVYCAV